MDEYWLEQAGVNKFGGAEFVMDGTAHPTNEVAQNELVGACKVGVEASL